MESVPVPVELIDRIATYLSRQPWLEVHKLLQDLASCRSEEDVVKEE